jgi:RNA polymerase sigma-70 factor (ECF subfamily)
MGTREIQERIASGDRDAWAELYQEYKRVVMSVCFAILRNEDEALDAAQETFVKVFENAKSLNPNGHLKGWLTTIAANLCRDKLRKRKRGLHWVKQWITTQKADWADGNLDVEVAKDFRAQAVNEAIAELDDEFRIPLVLKYYSDLSYREIASILSEQEGKPVAEDTVGSRINRAKGRLRDALIAKGVGSHE